MSDNHKTWQPLDAFSPTAPNSQIALIILNQPITKENEANLIRLWKKASVKLCVDGGTNRLYQWRLKRRQFNNNNVDDDSIYVPDFICGDLDSIDLNVLSHYRAKKSVCVHLNNQNYNDFAKTLKFTVNCLKKKIFDAEIFETNEEGAKYCLSEAAVRQLPRFDVDEIFCFCEFGGRLDHALANLHSLYDSSVREVNTHIISSECVTFLLGKGKNIIYVDNEESRGKYCGFFPLGKPSLVTTYGFKWNLDNQELNFATFISSSNEFDDYSEKEMKLSDGVDFDKKRKHVFIETVEPLIFTMSIN